MFLNILSLFCVQAANYAFPLVTLPYLWRVLGPTGYGEVGFALSFSQYFSILIDYGFALSATQAIARQQQDKEGRSRIFWSVTACKLLLVVGSFVLFIPLVLWVPALNSRHLVLIAGVPSFFGGVLFPIWLFQGMERMGGIAWCNLIGRVIVLPFVFLLVHAPERAWLAVFLLSASPSIVGVFSLLLMYRQDLITWASPNWKNIQEAFLDGWHVFIATAAVSLYTNSTVVILGVVADDQAVGLFVACDKIRQAAQGVTFPITQATYPRVNALMRLNQRKAFRFLRNLAFLLSLGTLVISILIVLFSEPILKIALGDRFVPAIDVLRWLAFLPFVVGLSNLFAVQTMLPLGMKREVSRILIASGLFSLLLIVPLSYYFQAQGAAAATLLTEIVVAVSMGAVLAKRLRLILCMGIAP